MVRVKWTWFKIDRLEDLQLCKTHPNRDVNLREFPHFDISTTLSDSLVS